jgi:hypothetical protein
VRLFFVILAVWLTLEMMVWAISPDHHAPGKTTTTEVPIQSHQTRRSSHMSTRTANTVNTTKSVAPKTARKRTPAKKTPTPQKSVTLRFDLERETPGAIRFTEQGDDKLVGTLYTRKDKTKALFGKTPKGYKLTVEPIF